jgi:hypothetical protein
MTGLAIVHDDCYTNLQGMKAMAFTAKVMVSRLLSVHTFHRAEEIVRVPDSYIHTNNILHIIHRP